MSLACSTTCANVMFEAVQDELGIGEPAPIAEEPHGQNLAGQAEEPAPAALDGDGVGNGDGEEPEPAPAALDGDVEMVDSDVAGAAQDIYRVLTGRLCAEDDVRPVAQIQQDLQSMRAREAAAAGSMASRDGSDTDDSSSSSSSAADLYGDLEDALSDSDSSSSRSSSSSDSDVGRAPSNDGSSSSGDAGPFPKDPYNSRCRRTVPFYQHFLQWKVYEGATMNVLAAVYMIASLKRTCRFHKAGMKDVCRLINALLPPGNLFPPSWKLVEGILASESVHRYEEMACPHCCRPFPTISRAQWDAHANDVCDICGDLGPRFKTLGIASRRPALRYFKMGVDNAISRWFADPEWARDRQRGLDEGSGPGTFQSSKYGKAVDHCCGGCISDPAVHCGLYGLGVLFSP